MARVVLAEDDQQLLAFFGAVLERAGHTVHLCATGDAALDAVSRDGADIVITDLAMSPGLDGWAIIANLRSEPSTATIPIMVISVLDDLPPKLPGAVAVLSKPVYSAELLKRVDAALSSGCDEAPET